MSDIGVFRANDGTFYTCCCREVILVGYKNCPRCKQEVISDAERYASTTGLESEALKGRLHDQYRWSGREQAGIIAARLQNVPYSCPHLCSECGWPIDDCKCWEAYQALKRKRRRK